MSPEVVPRRPLTRIRASPHTRTIGGSRLRNRPGTGPHNTNENVWQPSRCHEGFIPTSVPICRWVGPLINRGTAECGLRSRHRARVGGRELLAWQAVDPLLWSRECSRFGVDVSYSDFSLGSLVAFDAKWTAVGGLVLFKMYDDLTGEVFHSAAGKGFSAYDVRRATEALSGSLGPLKFIEMRCVPESTAHQILSHAADSECDLDLDSCDYLYSVEAIVKLEAFALRSRRRSVATSERRNPTIEFRVHDGLDLKAVDEVMMVLDRAAVEDGFGFGADMIEKSAIVRLLASGVGQDLVAVTAIDGGRLVGFTINEPQGGGSIRATSEGRYGPFLASPAGSNEKRPASWPRRATTSSTCSKISVFQDCANTRSRGTRSGTFGSTPFEFRHRTRGASARVASGIARRRRSFLRCVVY